MTEPKRRRSLLFRIRPAGWVLLIVMVLLSVLWRSAASPAAVSTILLGMAGLTLLSFLFLLAALSPVMKSAGYPSRRHRKKDAAELSEPGLKAGDSRTEALPPAGVSGASGFLPALVPFHGSAVLEADPSRPAFLPGVKLSRCWRLSFGPLRQIIRIPLASLGASSIEVTFSRRGLWTGRKYLELTDPFGLFEWDVFDDGVDRVAVPPRRRETTGDADSGRPSYDTASAPRPREDAEEQLERRDYRPGDDTRRLDWKQLARTGDMLVRIGDDTVPLRGRVWIDVVLPPSDGFPVPGIRNPGRAGQDLEAMDLLLTSADALVRRFRNAAVESMVRLPGEKDWQNAEGDSWPLRLAAALPAEPAAGLPPSGERLWILSHPAVLSGGRGLAGGYNRLRLFPAVANKDRQVLSRISEAGAAGLKVSLGLPAPGPLPPPLRFSDILFGNAGRDRERLESIRYRRLLSGNAVQEAGCDVRYI